MFIRIGYVSIAHWKEHGEDASDWVALGVSVSFVVILMTFVVYHAMLKKDVAIRSLAFEFIALNFGCAWLFFLVDESNRLNYSYFVFVLAVLAGAGAVLMHDGEIFENEKGKRI